MNASGIVPFLVIASLVAFSSCRNAKQNMQWINDKIDPAYTLASDLSKATTCVVIRVDDSYPNKKKPQNGGDLHGYAILSEAVPLSGKSREVLSGILADSSRFQHLHSLRGTARLQLPPGDRFPLYRRKHPSGSPGLL
jgi:hypothetical protein